MHLIFTIVDPTLSHSPYTMQRNVSNRGWSGGRCRQLQHALQCLQQVLWPVLTCHTWWIDHLRLRNSCCLIIFLEGFTIQYTFNIHSIYIQYTLGLSSFFLTESRWVLRLSWNYNTTILFFSEPSFLHENTKNSPSLVQTSQNLHFRCFLKLMRRTVGIS